MGHIIGQVLSGLLIGAIAQLLLRGNDPGGWTLMGFVITALIGMGGSFVGTLIGRFIWKDENYGAGWIMSIVGAVLLLLIYRIIF